MKNKTIISICLIIFSSLIVFGILIWPSFYRYDKIKDFIVKTNRLTGYTEILHNFEWVRVEDIKNIYKLSLDIKSKVIIIKNYDNDSSCHYNGIVYNGTNWYLKKIRISIEKHGGGNKIPWKKTYDANVTVSPFSTGSFTIRLADENCESEKDPFAQPLSEELIEAFGYEE